MAKNITAYCMKTRKKDVVMINPVINKVGNRYNASGKDKDGNVMFAFLSEESAKAYLKDGVAKKGKGF